MNAHRIRQMSWPAVLLALTLAIPTVTSAANIAITGVVKNEAGVAIGNVDIDFIDACTGDNVFLASDRTAGDGTFSISIAAGTYDIHFIPPAGVLAAGDMQAVTLAVNTSLGTVTLHPGRLVSGTVLTPSLAPAANVDIKWVDVIADHRVFLAKTLTDVAGHYSIRVPSGSYDMDFRPAATTTFADAERVGLVVGLSDIAGLSDVLKSGVVVTGTVRGRSNAKLKNVDIDLFDDCTGRRVPTAHDNTDINGIFSVIVPVGSYTLALDPPACDGVEALRQNGVVIAGATDLGTFTLRAAIPISGLVLGPNGLPLVGAKVKFYDVTAVPSVRQGTTKDRTDATGHFEILVPDNTYDVNIEPPVGVNALVYHINNLVTGAVGYDAGTLQLTTGIPLSGHVQGPGSVPLANVNVNILDQVTRVAQRVSHDNTDVNGNFTVYVNPGLYDIHFDPPACGGMAPDQLEGLSVSGPTVLPVENLVTGVHLLGSVVDPVSLPVVNVDLDVYPVGGVTKLYTPGDKTAATGAYDVLVRPGTYDVRYMPSSLTRLRPAFRTNIAMAANVTVPTVVLANGWLVSGIVRRVGTLLPLANVELQFYQHGTTNRLWTPHATTGTLGSYNTSVDAGSYDILYVAPLGSGLINGFLSNIVVGADEPLADQVLIFPSTGLGPGAGSGLSLAAPSPNPSRHRVHFTITVPDGDAELSAWDVAGRRVATLWHGRSAAPVTIQWDGTRDGGGVLPAGLYLVRLTDARGSSLLRRVTLLQ